MALIQDIGPRPVRKRPTPQLPNAARYKNFQPHPLLRQPPSDAEVQPKRALSQRPVAERKTSQTYHSQPVARPHPEPKVRDFPATQNLQAVPPKRRSMGRRLAGLIQYPLIAAAAVAAAYVPVVGQMLIGVYFLAVLFFKIPSKAIFTIAIVLLGCIPFFFILHVPEVSDNVAVYAYEMLAIGAFRALLELWKDSRKHKSTT